MTFLRKALVLVGLTVCRLGLPIWGIWLLGALLKRASDYENKRPISQRHRLSKLGGNEQLAEP
jgi:hypothetical protein